MSGFVSFVGSGPGDPELLTVKAVDRLRRADVILFDDLSSGPILSQLHPLANWWRLANVRGAHRLNSTTSVAYWWITQKQVRRLCA